MNKILTALGAVAVSFALATPAHADEVSYMQYLADRGYSGTHVIGAPVVGGGNPVGYAYMICKKLRAGRTSSDLVRRGWTIAEYALFVEAAQSELCPDTL